MFGADFIWSSLVARGVTTCFANPGTSEMHLVAALDRMPAMRGILGLQENVVTGAADGYGRMTDRPAATLLHLGPGLANGLANLHNARRAGVPIFNLVGDYNAEHRQIDAPLASDIESLARPMSDWVGRIDSADAIAGSIEQAMAVTDASGIATLIAPADVAWATLETAPGAVAAKPAVAASQQETAGIADVAELLLRQGKTVAFLLSGRALREAPLRMMAAVAAATGARFFCRDANSRIERGAGRTAVDKLPYAYQRALPVLAGVTHVVLVDAALPTTFFPYPGQPATAMPEGCRVIELCPFKGNPAAALAALAERLSVRISTPVASAVIGAEDPVDADLTVDAMNAIMARELPEAAIVCDEVITSVGFYDLSHHSAPHDYLQLTGGAIGAGIPLAVGAAVACPGRKVIGLQADGSGLFTIQGLWTAARENLDVTVVVFSNRSYRILQREMARVGADSSGAQAQRLLSLRDPSCDWVQLSKGFGVEAAKAESVAQFRDLWRHAMHRTGPFVIEAILP